MRGPACPMQQAPAAVLTVLAMAAAYPVPCAGLNAAGFRHWPGQSGAHPCPPEQPTVARSAGCIFLLIEAAPLKPRA